MSQYAFKKYNSHRLHCTYKYIRSLRNPSILSSTSVYSLPDYQTSLYIQLCSFITKSFNIIIHICLLTSRLSDFTVHTNMIVHYEILQYYLHICLLISRLSDFTVHTNMLVNYEIIYYYPPHLFIYFQTIRLHCTYKYDRSLQNPSILSSTSVYSLPDYHTSLYIQICSFITKSFNIMLHICLLTSRLSDFTVHTNMFVHYEILQYYRPYLFNLFHISYFIVHTNMIVPYEFHSILSSTFVYSYYE